MAAMQRHAQQIRDHAEDDVTPDADAPETSRPEDGDPSQATGNPNAAGG